MSKTNYTELWREIHEYAATYPLNPCDKAKRKAKRFYRSILDKLECEKCKNHYQERLESLCVLNRCHLFAWTVETHNAVNRLLGKSEVSFDDAAEMYGFQ